MLGLKHVSRETHTIFRLSQYFKFPFGAQRRIEARIGQLLGPAEWGGDRKAMVESEDWDGPAFQTCMDASSVCRAFAETSRRHEVLSFKHHREVAQLCAQHPDIADRLKVFVSQNPSYITCGKAFPKGNREMGRHERRRSVALFKRDARNLLETSLVPADADLADYPQLNGARAKWLSEVPARKPICSHCHRKFGFGVDGAEVAAFLLVTAPNSSSNMVGISGFCKSCWSDCDDGQLQKAALKVVRRVLPSGKFEE
jgi:hypothetical protein